MRTSANRPNRLAEKRIVISALAAVLMLSGCFGRKKATPQSGTGAEPDKILYDRALEDIKHGRHTIGRLSMQTLMNTYPDSEYLAKAKLAIADSFYKEGGSAGLKQSIEEYKSFETFFPSLPEAAYAQLQIARAHFRQMEKPDRDRSEARMAEEEFQVFLQKYPDDPLTAEATQRLREVQEVLAEGDFRVARFYYLKSSHRAAAARLIELTNRYPLYSQAHRANWMLGNIYERAEKGDLAAQYYARIVRDYPLCDLADQAKSRLTKLGVPVPNPSEEVLARARKEQELDRNRPGFLNRSTKGMLRSRPDVSMAARTGAPNLSPLGEASGTETLSAGKNTMGEAGGSTSAPVVMVQPVTPDASGSTATPAEGSTSSSAASANDPKPAAVNASSPAKPAETNLDASKSSADAKKDNKKQESSSKKKKGLRKVVPW